jgi:hypothetical protein
MSPPTLEQWRSLYAAAIEFRELACWDWMSDNQLFGVRNPESGEIGYCVVLGALDQIYALNVYRGSEGLRSYVEMSSAKRKYQQEAMYTQNLLMASFENRQALSDADLKIIKSLRLTFKGRNQWPLFRDYLPGYYPWYLDAGSVQHLAAALEQTIVVAQRIKRNDPTLAIPEQGLILLRQQQQTDAGIQWVDAWIAPTLLQPEKRETQPIDTSRVQSIMQRVPRTSAVFEVNCAYTPITIQEKRSDRPHFARLMLCVEGESGFVLGQEMLSPQTDDNAARAKLLNIIEGANMIPRVFRVKRPETYDLLAPIAAMLDVQIETHKKLPALDYMMRELLKFMNQR